MHPEPKRAFQDADVADLPSQDGGTLELHVRASNDAARAAISRVLSLVDEGSVRPEDLDMVEIALAEVFNNVVEHAYADDPDAEFIVEVTLQDPGMHFTIWDHGVPMPAGRLPGGKTADPDREGYEQAEGGYGLFLIRQLAKKLRYERVGDQNKLSFRIPLSPV